MIDRMVCFLVEKYLLSLNLQLSDNVRDNSRNIDKKDITDNKEESYPIQLSHHHRHTLIV